MNTFTFEGQEISLFNRRGYVDNVIRESETQIWSEARGPLNQQVVRSRTDHRKKLRVSFDDGEKETIYLSDNCEAEIDDDISIVYASSRSGKNGSGVGFVNHTEGRHWTLNEAGPVTFDWRRLNSALIALGVWIAITYAFYSIETYNAAQSHGSASYGVSIFLFFAGAVGVFCFFASIPGQFVDDACAAYSEEIARSFHFPARERFPKQSSNAA